jgi:hypothetical protein
MTASFQIVVVWVVTLCSVFVDSSRSKKRLLESVGLLAYAVDVIDHLPCGLPSHPQFISWYEYTEMCVSERLYGATALDMKK